METEISEGRQMDFQRNEDPFSNFEQSFFAKRMECESLLPLFCVEGYPTTKDLRSTLDRSFHPKSAGKPAHSTRFADDRSPVRSATVC
jgi:hypothetical protein